MKNHKFSLHIEVTHRQSFTELWMRELQLKVVFALFRQGELCRVDARLLLCCFAVDGELIAFGMGRQIDFRFVYGRACCQISQMQFHLARLARR